MGHHYPISLHYLPLLLSILFVSGTFPRTLAQESPPGPPAPPGPSSDPFLIGSLRSCAHNISGDVYVLNANQIKITNFSYDGQGNKTWFHIMTPKALSIHAALPDTFLPVANDKGECAEITKSFSKEELTITLPVVHPLTQNLTINQIKSFGLFSYGDCSNYGNVYFVHKWRPLYLSNLSLVPGPKPAITCLPPVFPNLSNPEFCNPGEIKFREFFGECVEQYGAIPRSGGALTVQVKIFGESFIFLTACLGMLMTAVR